jgi:hypothetical protein
MSKYDDLCQAYANSRKAYVDYRNACFGFAQELLEGLFSFLQVPEGRIRIVPVSREPDPEAVYTLSSAMHLDEDTYWHVGVVVDLMDAAGAFPPQAVLIKLLLKRHDGVFFVRLGQDGDDMKVREGQPQDMALVMEHIFGAVKESYDQGLQQFLDQDESTRKIGFGQ